MQLLTSLSFLWLIILGDAQQCISGGVYNEVFDKCFHFFNVKQSYDGSAAVCKSIGGVLVSIRNAFEQSLVVGNALKHFTDSDYWIGLSDQKKSGNWQWADGSQLSYTDWAAGYPAGEGKCVASQIKGGQWYNTDCADLKKFVCQVAPNQEFQDENKYCNGEKKMFGKCYYYFSAPQSSTDAQLTCGSLEGSLAGVHSQEELTYLLGNLKKHSITGDYWLGLRDRDDKDVWQWDDDGSFPSFTNWENGFPIGGVGMDCVTANIADGKWYNTLCYSGTNQFVCENFVDPVTSTTVTTTVPSSTPWNKYGWNYFNVTDSWYKYCLGGEDWRIQEEECTYQGSHLVSIHSEEENDFVRGLADSSMYLWTGLNSPNEDNNFSWSDNTTVDYQNWYRLRNESYDYYYCVLMVSDGGWENMPCDTWSNAVCKKHN